jgi:GLPGLI family protein
MKKALILIFSITTSYAQELVGKVEYQTIRNEKEKNILKPSTESSDDLSEDTMKAMEEAFEKAFQKKFLLSFTKNECLFEEIIELDKPKPNTDIMIAVSISGTGKKYLNLTENYSLLEEDMFGEELIIKDSLKNHNWVISEESKKIGDYLCYKASRTIPVSKNDMQAYERYLKKIESGKSVLFPMEKPKPQTITAWYAPDIPANFGPNGESGLPGLILKLETEELIYLCSKISIKNSEKLKIKKPNTGKIVTPAEFEKIEAKMRIQMEDNDGLIIHSTKN